MTNRIAQQIGKSGDQQGPARKSNGDGGHGQPDGQSRLRRSGCSGQQLKSAAQKESGLLSEIGQHRSQRPDMGRDIDGAAMILEPGQDRDQRQMAGGGDGKELGYPLNRRHDQQMQDSHAVLRVKFPVGNRQKGKELCPKTVPTGGACAGKL